MAKNNSLLTMRDLNDFTGMSFDEMKDLFLERQTEDLFGDETDHDWKLTRFQTNTHHLHDSLGSICVASLKCIDDLFVTVGDHLVYSPLPLPGTEKEYTLPDGRQAYLWTEKIQAFDEPFVITYKTYMSILAQGKEKEKTNRSSIVLMIGKDFFSKQGYKVYLNHLERRYQRYYASCWNQYAYLRHPLESYKSYNDDLVLTQHYQEMLASSSVTQYKNSYYMKTNYNEDLSNIIKSIGLLSLFEEEKKAASKDFDKLASKIAKEQKITLVQYKNSFKEVDNNLRKIKDFLKENKRLSKEMSALPELLLTISSIKDEIEQTYKYFTDVDSKMNIKNIDSRIKRLKDMKRVLQSIRNEK